MMKRMTDQCFEAWQRYLARLASECLPGRDAAATMLRMAANQRRNVANDRRDGNICGAASSTGQHVRYILAARRERKIGEGMLP